ncbi:MAG: tetratricopeptide repeat protein [Chloroflexota bacterium]
MSTSRTYVDSFTKQLVEALKHYNDTKWLGENSPLAAPYFLGVNLATLTANGSTDVNLRGKILQTEIRKAATRLPAKIEEGKRTVLAPELIEKLYFQEKTAEATAIELHMGRAHVFKHRDIAVNRLGELLLQQLNPTLRSEIPPLNPDMVGRDAQTDMCLEGLNEGKMVGIYGPSGIGKSTLGAALASTYAPQTTFWFTFRQGLNDNLKSFQFALGYFLNHHGSSSLWRQLITDEKIDAEMALGLIRHDLQQIQAQKKILLCFDEVDLLHLEKNTAYGPVVSFLEGLKGRTPILLMGQYLLIDPHISVPVPDLVESEIDQLLDKAQVQSLRTGLPRLAAYSQGNPRILEMLITLYRQSTEELEEVLSRSNSIPSLAYLLERIWLRLNDREQEILGELAVFQRSAPRDAWDNTMLKLIEYRLVQLGTQSGSVQLPKSFQDVIYEQLPPECLQSFHRHAAVVRERTGEYTSAARHLIRGARPDLAIWLWQRHQQQEIDQGQAESALSLFQEVSATPVAENLDVEDHKALENICATLCNLLGRSEDAQTHLRSTFKGSPVLIAHAKRLEGNIAEELNEFEEANRAYQEGLTSVENLLAEASQFHKNLGWVYLRQRDSGTSLDSAWEQALLARFEATRLMGHIQSNLGNYTECNAYFGEAIKLARDLGLKEHEAKSYHGLAYTLIQQGEIQEADVNLNNAEQILEQSGNKKQLAGLKVNRALYCNTTHKFEEAIQAAMEGLDLFIQLNQPYGQAVALQNLAEAYFAQGKLDEAERSAWQVLEREEIETAPDALRVLGEISMQRTDYGKAKEFFQDAIREACAKKDKFLEAYAQRAIGKLYKLLRQPDDANKAFQRALVLFNDLALSTEIEKTKEEWNRV